MKKISMAIAGLLLLAHSAFSQKQFDGIGEKGFYNSSVKGATAFYVPQMSIGFETYVETTVVVQEGKLSKLQNTFGAASKGKTYTGQSGSAKTTTILDAGLELADFQELANEFQAMLDSEIEKAGFTVLRMSEMDKYPSFAKVVEKYSAKTE